MSRRNVGKPGEEKKQNRGKRKKKEGEETRRGKEDMRTRGHETHTL